MTDLLRCRKCNQHVVRDEMSLRKHLVSFHNTIPAASKKRKLGMAAIHAIISIIGTFCLLKILFDQFKMIGIGVFLTGMFWGMGLLVLGILAAKTRDPLLDYFDSLEEPRA